MSTPQTCGSPTSTRRTGSRRHFRIHELTRSETADRQGIDNAFTRDDELRSAMGLARRVLQPIRDAFGPFSPNSVFRSQALERALKNRPSSWISTSQHTQGRACDVEIPGKPTLDAGALGERAPGRLRPDHLRVLRPAQGAELGLGPHLARAAGPRREPPRSAQLRVRRAAARLAYVKGLEAMA